MQRNTILHYRALCYQNIHVLSVCTLIHFKNMKKYKKLRKTIKDLIKITHFHRRIILHKIFKLNQRMSLSQEKRSIFPKTKYDYLPYSRILQLPEELILRTLYIMNYDFGRIIYFFTN